MPYLTRYGADAAKPIAASAATPADPAKPIAASAATPADPKTGEAAPGKP